MKTFEDKMAKLSPKDQSDVRKQTKKILKELKMIRALREVLNITQEELAERIRVQNPAISKLEQEGRNLTLETLSNVQ